MRDYPIALEPTMLLIQGERRVPGHPFTELPDMRSGANQLRKGRGDN